MANEAAREPSVASLLREATSGGWDFFHTIDEKGRERFERGNPDDKRARLAAAMSRLDADPGFHEVLETLLDATLRRVTFVSHLSVDPGQAASYASFREGQNSVVMMMLQMIAQGREQTMKGRDA